MARLPRIVIHGYPHHVTQRGNRRTRTFFEDGDFATFLAQEDVCRGIQKALSVGNKGTTFGFGGLDRKVNGNDWSRT